MFIEEWHRFSKDVLEAEKYEKYNVLPMVNKFLRYEDTNYHITSCTCILENMQENVLADNMEKIIKSQTLLKSILIRKGDKVKLKTFENHGKLHIPILELNSKDELEGIVDEYIKDLINQDIYGNLLYRFAFLKLGNKFLFFFISNHIIYDGAFNFKKYLESKNPIRTDSYEEVSEYVEKLYEKYDENSFSAINSKAFLACKDYSLSSKTETINFQVSFNEILESSDSLEEPLVEILFNTLTQCLKKEELPMCILDNGRNFGNRKFVYNQLGDLHDEKHFVLNKKDYKEKFKRLNAIYKNNRFLSLAELELANRDNYLLDDAILVNINYYIDFPSNDFDDLVNCVKRKNKTSNKHYIRIMVFYDIMKDLCYFSVKYNSDLGEQLKNFELVFRSELNQLLNERVEK